MTIFILSIDIDNDFSYRISDLLLFMVIPIWVNPHLTIGVLSSDKEVNSNCRAAQRFAMPFCFFFAVQSLGCRWED